MRFDLDQLEFTGTASQGDKLAFACSDIDLTWNELQEKTNALAKIIAQLKTDSPVIIYGSKEHFFPVAMLACIKMKVPYVAVDKIIPAERIAFIIDAAKANIVISCFENTTELNVPFIISPDLSMVKKDLPIQKNESIESGLCYILFTSGSTGTPKGVKISLESVKSFSAWMNKEFPVRAETVFVNQATFSFDISLVEFLGTITLGATGILNAPELTKQSPLEFIHRIKKYNGNFWNSTPSFIYQYLMHPEFNSQTLPSLQKFLFMGEELPSKIVERIFTAFEDSKVYNAYGPTEATVVTTFIEITKEIVAANPKSLPIGFPKADGKILIANETNDHFASGEIQIVGDHVSNGYLNDIPLSGEKFFGHDGKRAYRTGDLGYYKGGMVFFEGRMDDQVKYNGYRIELDEINSSLHRIPGITEAVTIALKAGITVKKLVAFIKVEKVEGDLAQYKAEVKRKLLISIPEYMIPSELCIIEEFPVNVNHKIDKKELVVYYSKGFWK